MRQFAGDGGGDWSARWSAAWPGTCSLPIDGRSCGDRSSRRSTTSRASSTASAATISKAAGVASEGWKLLNEALGDSGQAAQSRYPSARQTSPF